MQTEMRTSMQREVVAHLTAMDMTMKCPHSSIKNLPLCLTTRLKEQRKKDLNWKEKNCVECEIGKESTHFECCSHFKGNAL